MTRRLFYFAIGTLSVVLIFVFFNWSGSQSFVSVEKGVASFSPKGVAGGVSVPASCESVPYGGSDRHGGTCCAPGAGSAWCASPQNSCGQVSPGTLQCDGSCSASPPPNSSCPQSPGSFGLGGAASGCNSMVLAWTASSNADTYRIFRDGTDISPYQPYGALNFVDTTVGQNTSYSYRVDAYNGVGTSSSNTVNITTPYCSPALSLSTDKTSVYQNQSVILTWLSAYTTSCTASANPAQSNWSGSKDLNNATGQSVTPLPPPQVIYTMQCSGSGGPIERSVIIEVLPLALPDWREIIPR